MQFGGQFEGERGGVGVVGVDGGAAAGVEERKGRADPPPPPPPPPWMPASRPAPSKYRTYLHQRSGKNVNGFDFKRNRPPDFQPTEPEPGQLQLQVEWLVFAAFHAW